MGYKQTFRGERTPSTRGRVGGERRIYTIYEVKQYEMDGDQQFSKKLARDLLNIRQRQTFNLHLKSLGMNGKRIGWDEIKEILALRLFIYKRIGSHTREMYVFLKSQGLLEQVFKELNIDLETEFQGVKQQYEQWKRQRQI